MRVRTENGLTFDMTLSGHEAQKSFTDEKYRALTGGSPQGRTLQMLVDQNWEQWLKIVEHAPWLRNWSQSKLHAKNQKVEKASYTLPSGEVVPSHEYRQHRIASAIYAEAVWGYGMTGWLRGKHVVAGTDAQTKTNSALRTLHLIQGLRYPNPLRKYTWDDKIYIGCGLLVPTEFGELDRWLEPLWYQAQEMVQQRLNQLKSGDLQPRFTGHTICFKE